VGDDEQMFLAVRSRSHGNLLAAATPTPPGVQVHSGLVKVSRWRWSGNAAPESPLAILVIETGHVDVSIDRGAEQIDVIGIARDRGHLGADWQITVATLADANPSG